MFSDTDTPETQIIKKKKNSTCCRTDTGAINNRFIFNYFNDFCVITGKNDFIAKRK